MKEEVLALFPHVQEDELELPSLATADSVLDLLVQSNQRSFNNELGLYVHNKLQLRNSVLASYTAPEETRNILRAQTFCPLTLLAPYPSRSGLHCLAPKVLNF